MRGLPLPGGQSYADRVEELVEAARIKQVEMDYAEGRILDEERKMGTRVVSRKGRRCSGSGDRRGVSGKAGRICGLARDSGATTSGSASSSHSGGPRPSRR